MDAYDRIANGAITLAISKMEIHTRNLKEYGDSPIERYFFAALYMSIKFGPTNIDGIHVFESPEQPNADHFDDPVFRLRLFLCQQFQVGSCRVDFCASIASACDKKIISRLIVECDGHDYHERTKEQARNDRSRDRTLQDLGFTVYRFTGSEIYNNPMKCADQVVQWAEAALIK